jgi:AmiR/NasT family two-component response regulator
MPATYSRSGGIVSVDEDLQVESNSDVVESLTQQIEQLEIAVDHRTTIGQAQGILMARLSIDADTAFEYLERVSSHANRKLIDIAAEVTQTLELPETES